jgi:hypothetical protein
VATFYFRSLVSFVLWVPLFVFIVLYFVYRSPFILKRWSSYKLQEYKHKQRNPQSTRHKRSKIKGDLDTKYKKLNTLYFVSLSPFILDFLCLVYCGFLCLCLYSCILYLYHLLIKIQNTRIQAQTEEPTVHKTQEI